ncbi:hypothetical protein GE061_018036 [Apolygus lucorum]|uniref:Uncharacterized protein n=1 Tax=Apolygus lucorum TaxID=248454 RepID=A0A8S9XCK9_APOLU|nr:hypothetical protein GE061_018036 [Apolygus lucorum]
MSSKRCYNNDAFITRQEGFDVRDSLNNRLELGAFHAYNETFVDDNGCEMFVDDEFVDIRDEARTPLRYVRAEPKCRRSIAAMPMRQGRGVAVGFHRERYGSLNEAPRHRYESVGSDDAPRSSTGKSSSSSSRSSSMRLQQDGLDLGRKRYADYEVGNEEYVDYPEDRMGYSLPIRESPLGSANRVNPELRSLTTPVNPVSTHVTPVTTPKKNVQLTPQQRTPTFSTPTKISKRDSIILAPMIANIERQMSVQSSLHRSKSTIVSSPKKPILRTPERTVAVSPRQVAHENQQLSRQSATLGRSMPSLKYYSPAKLQSFSHYFDADFLDSSPNRTPRKPNTAIITPNMRSSIAPLLTPPREHHPSPVLKSPSSYSKGSWANLPTIHLPTELLCCVGFILLAAGAASCILCFYILAITGRRYFLNFGAVGGFLSLLIGLFSFRTNKWKWLPHRNYMTGYVLLGVFSFLNAACLSGIVYATDAQSFALFDTLGGAVCGISTLVIVGALIGLVTSHCCHRPPPDNRVSHSVSGFIV